MKSSIEEIFAEMKGTLEEKTGVAISCGGDMYIRLYALAEQLYSLWVQADWLKKQSFPQTAEGEYLDYHAQMRGLQRLEATKATGELRFSVPSAAASELSVPAGTVCRTQAGIEFETDEDAVVAAGETYCDVAATSMSAGSSGNVPAGSVIVMTQAPVGISSCVNTESFSGGSDVEADEELRERVIGSYKRLPNGANAAYYEMQVLDTDGVDAVAVLPKHRGVGTVDVIFSTADGVPSVSMIERLQSILDEKREMCVDVLVRAPQEVSVDVGIGISVTDGYGFEAVASNARAALTEYFSGGLLGTDILLAKLGSIVFEVEGVANYSISSPAADMSIQADELPILTGLSVAKMGV